MDDHTIERTAIRLIQKYGMKALPKAVDVARYYLEEGDDDSAKRWVRIGYAVKHQLNLGELEEIIKSATEEGTEADKIPESVA